MKKKLKSKYFYFYRVQTMGLGGLKPNTVILGWPYGWSKARHDRSWLNFLETVRTVSASRMALLVPKGINCFPESTEKVIFKFKKKLKENTNIFPRRLLVWLTFGGLYMTEVYWCCYHSYYVNIAHGKTASSEFSLSLNWRTTRFKWRRISSCSCTTSG